MNLPENLTLRLDELEERYGIKALKSAAETLSLAYREGVRDGRSHLSGEVSAAAYAISRMPATFGAVSTALKYINQLVDLEEIESLLDVGAGMGTASLAIRECTELSRNTLIERDSDMLNLGRSFLDADWIKGDSRTTQYPTSDMVVSSYMLNELSRENRLPTVEKMWKAAGKLLLIVENGTPKGYEIIKEIREWAKGEGISIAAPCPNVEKCPMDGDDWCHFTCRVARSRTHKLLKGGDAPYEDEKFTYIALSREKATGVGSRVLRHPKIESGKITLSLCTEKGMETAVVTKKDKAAFKAARKASAGDGFNL